MNCEDTIELSPLWHTGELDSGRRQAFDTHIASCVECAAELRDQSAMDAHVRESFTQESARDFAAAGELERRVMRQIAGDRMRRWMVPGMAVAAAILAAVLFTRVHRAAPPNPAVFADAARDHTVEVIQETPRRWRTAPAEIATLVASQGLTPADVKAVEVTGYQLQRGKICRLGGMPYLHLVYGNAGHEFSVYMKVRRDKPTTDSAASEHSLQLASFTRGQVQAVIVTDASRDDCDKFAKAVEDAL